MLNSIHGAFIIIPDLEKYRLEQNSLSEWAQVQNKGNEHEIILHIVLFIVFTGQTDFYYRCLLCLPVTAVKCLDVGFL